jgi:hypothetical protein
VSITGKTRSIARRGVTLERRIAIIQALFWPALLGIGVLIGATVLLTRRLGRGPVTSATVGTGTTLPVDTTQRAESSTAPQ